MRPPGLKRSSHASAGRKCIATNTGNRQSISAGKKKVIIVKEIRWKNTKTARTGQKILGLFEKSSHTKTSSIKTTKIAWAESHRGKIAQWALRSTSPLSQGAFNFCRAPQQ